MTFSIDFATHRSPNHRSRVQAIVGLVLHTCEGDSKAPLVQASPRRTSIPWLTSPASGVSCHYYVCRDATVYQLVDDSRVAYHAGYSVWRGRAYLNEWALGIELEHRAGQDWPSVQLDAAEWLCRRLIGRYLIPQENVVAHRWVATDEQLRPSNRRSDPSNFPDASLRAWIARLYAPARPIAPVPPLLPRRYRVAVPEGALIRPTPARSGPPIGGYGYGATVVGHELSGERIEAQPVEPCDLAAWVRLGDRRHVWRGLLKELRS